MFTGLVQATGEVARLDEGAQSLRVEVKVALPEGARKLGASIAVNGVCLTAVQSNGSSFEADVAFETLEKTTLGELGVGARVNIETSLCLGDPLGGHLVSGHVDGVGRVRSVQARGEARKLGLWAPAPLRRYIATKGSICIDGVSLTVNEVDDEGFFVGIVPHTLEVTTLGELSEGAAVNLEVDLLARYVERMLSHGAGAATGGLSVEQLAKAGFLSQPSSPKPSR